MTYEPIDPARLTPDSWIQLGPDTWIRYGDMTRDHVRQRIEFITAEYAADGIALLELDPEAGGDR